MAVSRSKYRSKRGNATTLTLNENGIDAVAESLAMKDDTLLLVHFLMILYPPRQTKLGEECPRSSDCAYRIYCTLPPGSHIEGHNVRTLWIIYPCPFPRFVLRGPPWRDSGPDIEPTVPVFFSLPTRSIYSKGRCPERQFRATTLLRTRDTIIYWYFVLQVAGEH